MCSKSMRIGGLLGFGQNYPHQKNWWFFFSCLIYIILIICFFINIRLAHLAWTKPTPKWRLKYFENGINLMDGVKTIWLPSIFLTLFMHVHIGIIKNDHGWGHVALYPRWPHVLIAKLFQLPNNDVCPTVKKLSGIFWRKIKAWTYDFH